MDGTGDSVLMGLKASGSPSAPPAKQSTSSSALQRALSSTSSPATAPAPAPQNPSTNLVPPPSPPPSPTLSLSPPPIPPPRTHFPPPPSLLPPPSPPFPPIPPRRTPSPPPPSPLPPPSPTFPPIPPRRTHFPPPPSPLPLSPPLVPKSRATIKAEIAKFDVDMTGRNENLELLYHKDSGYAGPQFPPWMQKSADKYPPVYYRNVFEVRIVPATDIIQQFIAGGGMHFPKLPLPEYNKIGHALEMPINPKYLEWVSMYCSTNKRVADGLEIDDKKYPNRPEMFVWPDDWMGQLGLFFKEIAPLPTNPSPPTYVNHVNVFAPTHTNIKDSASKMRQFHEVHVQDWRMLIKFFAMVMHHCATPTLVTMLLTYAASRESCSPEQKHDFMHAACMEVFSNREVLREDGWSVDAEPCPPENACPPLGKQPPLKVSDGNSADGTEKKGATAAASRLGYIFSQFSGVHCQSLIGLNLVWEDSEAVIIAYIHDPDIGDLWKLKNKNDEMTVDLDFAEMQKALKDMMKQTKRDQKLEAQREAKKKKNLKRKSDGGGSITQGSGNFNNYEKAAFVTTAISGRGPPKKAKVTEPDNSEDWSAYTVDNVSSGIVLASPRHKNARPDLLWPARIMHATETTALREERKAMQKGGANFNNMPSIAAKASDASAVYVVFLSPYWGHGTEFCKTSRSKAEFNKIEAVTVSPKSIQAYPLATFLSSSSDKTKTSSSTLNITSLRSNFKETGLPKHAFKKYLTSHRLAVAFSSYASSTLVNASKSDNSGSAKMLECHRMSLETAEYTSGMLDLPWHVVMDGLPSVSIDFIASEVVGGGGGGGGGRDRSALTYDLTKSDSDSDSGPGPDSAGPGLNSEPILELGIIVDGLKNPDAFSLKADGERQRATVDYVRPLSYRNPLLKLFRAGADAGADGPSTSAFSVSVSVSDIVSAELKPIFDSAVNSEIPTEIVRLGNRYCEAFADAKAACEYFARSSSSSSSSSSFSTSSLSSMDGRKILLAQLLTSIILLKSQGESTFTIATVTNQRRGINDNLTLNTLLSHWRISCENLYRYARMNLSCAGLGSGVTAVLTDEKCRGHLTASGSFERAVRLPAAIKGAANAGAGKTPNFIISHTVKLNFVSIATKVILPMVHERRYLSKLQKNVSALSLTVQGAQLTDDSDGEGGGDTSGSSGSFTAATHAVACALQAVNMVANGEVTNAFCATRPPGHHAGTSFRSMNATSNGFCLLNSAACAAKYAVLGREHGGMGMRRVAVVDFDVHHGNGTQDVLCKTFDPRFLYISMHAGGGGGVGGSSYLSGSIYDNDSDSDADEMSDDNDGEEKKNQIFPGTSGDTSPHKGVLNIPLGSKVTAPEIARVMQTLVRNALNTFQPDMLILSAGFDAHKNDPLGLGGLTASDFKTLTSMCVDEANLYCAGRVVSILEGGYGVPCCKFAGKNLFLPPGVNAAETNGGGGSNHNNEDPRIVEVSLATRAKIGIMSGAGNDCLDEMPDKFMRELVNCAEEGFLECVEQHCRGMKEGAEKENVE